jgi:plastocyanin
MRQKNAVRTIRLTLPAVLLIAAAACSTEKKEETGGEATPSTSGTQSTQPAAGGVALTGDTIIVELWTDPTGNYFKPKDLEAHPGDVIRYTLKAGVHNVHFLPDSNTIKTGLPPVSDFLQLPDQTYDLVVNMQPGKYYFQCDPHAALGMKGKLEVEKKD